MELFKKILSVVLRVAISITLLIFLFKQVDIENLVEIIKNADKGFLILAFFIFFLSYFLCLFRWEMLLKATKIHLPLKRIIISFAGGHFFNLFLPSTIGGDVMRSIDLAVHTKRFREVIATVLLDRLSGYVGLVILVILAILFGARLISDISVFISLVIIVGLLLLILLVLFNKFLYSKVNKFLSPHIIILLPARFYRKRKWFFSALTKFRERLKDLHREIHIFRNHKEIILNNLILSILIQAITPVVFYIIALSLGIKISIIYFFIFLPIIGAITLLPISIGGLGLRDATTVFFFTKANISKDLAFAMSLVSFFFILIYAAIGGLIYVLTVHHRRIQHHQPPSIQPARH